MAAVPDEKKEYGCIINQAEAERIERMALALSEQSPPWAAKYISKLAPFVGVLGAGCEVVGPQLLKLCYGVYLLYQHLPKTAAKGLSGLGVCYFGGKYAVSIAATEAFWSTGGSRVLKDLQDLVDQANEVRNASLKDDEEDADNDGVADVKQINAKQLASRKTSLVLKTIDTEIVSRACHNLWTAYMGILTVLKFKFARTVALAESIGNTLRPTIAKVAGPTLVSLAPPDYRKWISPSINILAKLVAGYIAWKVQQLTSTVQSAFCGGMIASRALLELLRQQKLMVSSDDETYLDEAIGWTLGASGIYVQLFKGGPVPYFMTPLFWPLDFIEAVLKWNLTWIEAPTQKEISA
mmetsp:Transcript_125387/g.244175  ORF Transcript_125387/g.244175 Transcript_125387/m.244175 type:complete len:352 (-) Transcript_125387:82-1137(-)